VILLHHIDILGHMMVGNVTFLLF